MHAPDLFKGRHFDQEVIILCVRWYLSFKLSLRDLVQMIVVLGDCVTAGIVVEHMPSEIRSDRQNSSKLTGDERRHGNAAWRYRSSSDTEHKARS